MSIFHRVHSRRAAILAAHPEMDLDTRFMALRRRLGHITTGSCESMRLKDCADLNEARALLAEIDKLNADWASVDGASFGLFVSADVRDALVEAETEADSEDIIPETVIFVTDDRVESEGSWEGLVFPDIDTFRKVMEADGQGETAEEILAEMEAWERGDASAERPGLEVLTFTGERRSVERRPDEHLSGPVYTGRFGLYVLPYDPELFTDGVNFDITCFEVHPEFRGYGDFYDFIQQKKRETHA